jgi:hypothetical protein
MKSIVTQLSLCLLVLSGLRLATLVRAEWRHYRASGSRNAAAPSDSSLYGIDADGKLLTPRLGADGHIRGNGHLLVFVIHRDEVATDIQYWNRVTELVSGSGAPARRPLQYWGICDDGSRCNSYQPVAKFSIVGYLDPYQMHVAARADARREALLYGYTGALKARLARTADPSALSNTILRHTSLR